MPYIPQQSPSGIDSEGVRAFTENEFRNIARSWTELEVALVSAGVISPGTGSGGAGGGIAVRGVQKNYVINGSMQISQENGAAAATTSGYYPVDQFTAVFAHGGVSTIQQVASATPGGSPNRIRITATTADATVAAGDVLLVKQLLEGFRVVDLRMGTTSAKTVTIRFGIKAPAGTYSLALRNGPTINRYYIAEFVITAGEANVEVAKSIVIALDKSGTYSANNLFALEISWVLMAGSNFVGTTGAWTNGSLIASINQFNFMSTTAPNNVFELFDVSVTEGSAAPPFVVPDYVRELVLCQRYYEAGGAYASAATGNYANVDYKVTKRAPAAVAFNVAFTGLAVNASGTYGFHFTTTTGIVGFNYTANARM